MNIFKILLTLPYFILTITKSRSMTKKTLRDPDVVEEEFRYKWTHKRSRYLLWLLGVKVVVHNPENWDHNGCLIAANHQSNLDPLVLFKINDFAKHAPAAFIAKKELATDKKFKNYVHLIDVLFLDRKNPRQALEVLNHAKELIRVPRSMILFPEGHRSNQDEMIPFKPSLFKIAQKAHVPIIPCAIVNSYRVNSHDKENKRKYIHVVFHTPIKTSNFITKETAILANQIQIIIRKSIEKYKNISDNDSKILYKKYKKSLKKKQKD